MRGVIAAVATPLIGNVDPDTDLFFGSLLVGVDEQLANAASKAAP